MPEDQVLHEPDTEGEERFTFMNALAHADEPRPPDLGVEGTECLA